MENLLPLLLGLIFVGVKYYNKKQKDKAQNAPPLPVSQSENTEKFSPTIEGFMENLYEGIKDQFEEPKLTTVPPPISSQNTWIEEEVEELPESIEFTERKIVRKKAKTQFETIQNKGSKTTESIDFDLRKAVIYNAIMNPPYL